jgi:aminoglycoside phosphotransferase (APT) family kinase protein
MKVFLESKKFERIVQKTTPKSKLIRAWPLAGGMSAEMTALEVARPDGLRQKLVVRQFGEGEPGRVAAAKEFRLLQITHTAGLSTPIPYHLDLSGQILPTPYLVIEYIEGEMLFAPVDLPHHLAQLATHLAAIHSLNYTGFDLSFLGEPTNYCAEMTRPHSDPITPLFNEAEIRTALTSHSLAHSQTRKLAPSLLHGDFWPGNSLWRDDQLVAVIDWEDALLGDPLLDLARSRSEIAWIFGIEAMEQFTAHYQSLMPLDYTHLPTWDLCAALRQIRLFNGDLVAAAAFFTPYGRGDITPQTIQANYQQFIRQVLSNRSFLT